MDNGGITNLSHHPFPAVPEHPQREMGVSKRRPGPFLESKGMPCIPGGAVRFRAVCLNQGGMPFSQTTAGQPEIVPRVDAGYPYSRKV